MMKQLKALDRLNKNKAFQASCWKDEIPVQIFKGSSVPGSAPLLLFFHGGMFNTGTIRDAGNFADALSSHATVVCVGYPLAPQLRFPEATEVAYEALLWTASMLESLDADPDRLYVAGEQAGGNLAAAIALIARDRRALEDMPFSIAGQILITPLLDPYQMSASMRSSAEQAYRRGWSAYLPHPADASHPYAAPLYSRRLAGLPDALIISADHDPLRDEAETYASVLAEAGARVQSRRFPKVAGNVCDRRHPAFDDLVKAVSDFVTGSDSEIRTA